MNHAVQLRVKDSMLQGWLETILWLRNCTNYYMAFEKPQRQILIMISLLSMQGLSLPEKPILSLGLA